MDLSYPIGEFEAPAAISTELLQRSIAKIAAAPARMCAAVNGLDNTQLDTPYRPDGWTVRQVVHHLADSHANCYVRFRLALTEENPTIKPYDQDKWAFLEDARSGPVDISLRFLEAMHGRWVLLMNAMTPDDFTRTFFHPERGAMRLDLTVLLYAWHCLHHEAHIVNLRKRMGWV